MKEPERDNENPETIEELCDYIVRYAGVIFVREEIDGKWGSHSLTQLPGQLAVKHALRFVRDGVVPVCYVGGE